ncbi:sensor histidine kinase [Uliginosibacterium sediminicola]|uniref:histidine kinase n=1 Tax=Uliginosibacterium sediminicola TaxID=2024550 RepID=A0ABU9Z251_9RHOO
MSGPLPSQEARNAKALSLPPLNVLLMVVAGNTLVALLVWAMNEYSLWSTWIISQCQGLSVYAIYALLFRRLKWRIGRAPSIILSSCLGLPAGLYLAQFIGFQGVADHLFSNSHSLLRYVLIGAVFTLGFTYYFSNRLRIARLEQARQEAALREAQGQKAALRAELRLLQAQIEPHFLFNTLANLHSLIGRDDALAKTLLERLNDYLRASLSHSRAEQATLGDEFAMLSAYLAIQQLRMGGRLQTQVELAEALREAAFPPMLLQPLVENAIIHGIEPKLGAGRVSVMAAGDAQQLRIVVEDDGVGFGASTGGSGLGLTNVRERLSALFGSAATLEIRDHAPTGVRVELCLPREKY